MEKTRRNWWCNFRSLFFSQKKRCAWFLSMVLGISQGICDYFFQSHGWTCNSFIVRSLLARCDPLQRQIGHLQVSCGDPNKVFHSDFLNSRCFIQKTLSFCCLGTGKLCLSVKGSNIWSKEWSLGAAHWVQQKEAMKCMFALSVLEDAISQHYPAMPHDAGDEIQLSVHEQHSYIFDCSPENY